MNKDHSTEIPVVINGNEQIVYSVPARAKKKPSWWYRNADGLLLIWGCVVLMVWIWVNP